MDTALRLSEERYRVLFEESPTGNFVSAPDGGLLGCNQAFARLLGCRTREEVLGTRLQEWTADVRLRDELLERVRSQKKLGPYELELRRRDGAAVSVLEHLVGIFGEGGELVEVVGLLVDVTWRKRLESELRQAQKLEAVGRLAGGIAHDFNNMLLAIRGRTELLLAETSEPAVRAELEEIGLAVDRAAGLTRQLLAFGQKQVLSPTGLDLNAVVRDLETVIRRLAGESIELALMLDPALGSVNADPTQLEQVLLNLATNAREAMPHGGTLRIETANALLHDGHAIQYPKVRPGRYVLLVVGDTGTGMDADTQSHVFEPFFTTKEQRAGLGLSTVHGIVEQSGGHIWVSSEPGRGTTFRIYLPRATELPATGPRAPARPTGAPPKGWETILLVEDEATVRDVVRKLLERNGYAVLAAADGPEAERVADAHGGLLHLMVTDVMMPNMTGRELAERMSLKRPEMKVLFMSGYTAGVITRHAMLNPGTAFIQKPFTLEAFAHKVREVLEQR